MLDKSDRSRAAPEGWLAFLPPTFFGSVLGVTGLGLAWRRAEEAWHWVSWPGDIILIAGAIILLAMLPAYGLKFLNHSSAVRGDIAHPVKGPFVAAMPLAVVLQVPAVAPVWFDAAVVIFIAGAIGSLGINLYLFQRWFLLKIEPESFNAIWLIPGVGSFIVAITGIPIGFVETGWFFFSIGLVFWVFLSAVLMYRYMFHDRHPDPLAPSYFVPIVPPGLVSMIYPMLDTGVLSSFTRVIYYFALFWFILMLAMIRVFLRLKFSMGWWAYTFPMVTLTSATIMFSERAGLPMLGGAGGVLLAGSTILVSGILARTLWEIARGNVLVPDQTGLTHNR